MCECAYARCEISCTRYHVGMRNAKCNLAQRDERFCLSYHDPQPSGPAGRFGDVMKNLGPGKKLTLKPLLRLDGLSLWPFESRGALGTSDDNRARGSKARTNELPLYCSVIDSPDDVVIHEFYHLSGPDSLLI